MSFKQEREFTPYDMGDLALSAMKNMGQQYKLAMVNADNETFDRMQEYVDLAEMYLDDDNRPEVLPREVGNVVEFNENIKKIHQDTYLLANEMCADDPERAKETMISAVLVASKQHGLDAREAAFHISKSLGEEGVAFTEKFDEMTMGVQREQEREEGPAISGRG